jgi:multidrug efflux pump subunit AcrB
MQQPLAIAIIAGLIFSLPLVLIVLPALLAMFQVNDIPSFVAPRKAAEE